MVASYDHGTVLDWAWADDGSGLLFTGVEDEETYVMLLRTDGEVERLSDGTPGPPEEADLTLVR